MANRIKKDGVIYEYVSGPSDDMRSYRVIVPEFKPEYGLADIGRSALTGATLGWADEMAGLVHGGKAALSLENPLEAYGQARDAYRAAQSQFRQDHPIAATAAEMGGGVATGIAGGLKAAGSAAGKKMLQLPLTQRLLASSGLGGATGAVTGAGEAQTIEDIPEQAKKGAAIGAVVSPMFEGLASGAQALARQAGPQKAADRALRKAAQRGEMSLQQVQRKLKVMGPGTVLADVNEGFRTELDKLANMPGKTRTRAIKELTKRSTKQVNEILDATGQGKYFEVLDGIRTGRKQAATPLYTKAYKQGVNHNDELESIFNGLDEVMPEAWGQAKKYGKMEFVGSGKEIPDLGDARPTLRGWQAVKEVLDDKIGALIRKGKEGQAGKLLDIKRRLLSELDSQNPDYAAARNVWAGSKAFESSMDEGLSFMRPGITAGKLRHDLSKMTDAEKIGYREGARQAIQDTLERAGFTHDAAKFFMKPAMVDKMKALFGAKEARKMLRIIKSSSEKQKTFAKVAGNSATALRQAAQREDSLGQEALGVAMDALSQNPTSAASNFARRALGAIPTSRESTRDLVGNALLETNPAQQMQVLQYLMGGGTPLPPVQGAGLLPPALIGATGGLLAAE